MSSTTGQPRNRRYIRVSQQRRTKLRWPENSTRYRAPKRTTGGAAAAAMPSIYTRVYTSEADFHKPEMCGGSARVWANAWDVFHCTPSRGGRGRRAAVDLFRGVFCLVFGWISCFFCSFSLLRTHTACCKYEAASCLIYLSTSTGVRTGCHYLISLSVGPSVCLCACQCVCNLRRFY